MKYLTFYMTLDIFVFILFQAFGEQPEVGYEKMWLTANLVTSSVICLFPTGFILAYDLGKNSKKDD